METMPNVNFQHFTALPLKVIEKPGQLKPDILVTTPHKGEIVLNLQDIHYPFLFGSTTQTERGASEVVAQLKSIEWDAYQFLLRNWLDTLPS